MILVMLFRDSGFYEWDRLYLILYRVWEDVSLT